MHIPYYHVHEGPLILKKAFTAILKSNNQIIIAIIHSIYFTNVTSAIFFNIRT